jgi:Zn-dependent protease/CBS domain-containing protein
MQTGFRVGRLFGINIRINWSWLLIFLLISWNLASVFSQMHTDWSLFLIGSVAVSAAILFFASVLAHEMAHSLVAQTQGLSVRGITLFLFGGVSNIQREPPSPRAEFLITIVGPLTSILLGILFFFLGYIFSGQSGLSITGTAAADPTAVISQLGPVTTILFWLAPVNILLGVFNMIPGFPLDGGRILRSILWAFTGNLRRATRWASWVGQIVAWLMILAGVAMIFGANLPIFGTGFVSGIWLAFIGWFLNGAAVQSYRQVMIRDLLEDVPISRVMRSNPLTVAANSSSSINALIDERIMATDERAFPVQENDHLAGLVTLEDIRQIPRTDWDETSVGQIMTPFEQLVTVTTEQDAADAFQKLQQRDVRQLPVMENGRLVGLLRRRDIMKWLQLQGDIT